ncbi:hypothetical protein [Photorhabdus caribbeanensis]|uniref:hypothetical protein n=1 Tax=Photorhabdus caribbeanensis TaxID=1004165 RepID=UPI001FE87FA7|nr:hypothetical protein [Photorhabdus caribbeanensis]
MQEYAATVELVGADRLRLSDTIGILNSQRYAQRVSAVRQASAIDLQCHCHIPLLRRCRRKRCQGRR